MTLTSADIAHLTSQLLWAVLALGAVFGALAQRSHFCTMGAIADVVNLGDTTRLRMWAMAIAVAVIGFNLMVGLGWVDAGKSIYGGPRVLWASGLVGGLMFGFGMVLASGCGNRNLVRLGGGNLKSLVVVLVLGLSAWATLRGITGVWRTATVDQWALVLPVSQDLPSLLARASGGSVRTMALGLGLLLGGGLLAWSLASAEARRPGPLIGGLGSGAVVLAAWWLSGVAGYLPEHPETLEPTFLATASQRMEAISFVGPVAQGMELLVFYSDTSRHLSLGIVAVIGVVAGACVASIASREFRLESFRDPADMARHLVGAVLMGVGGVTALGCTVGQGISGVSTLGLTSVIALAGIVLGCVAGLRFLVWQLERSA
ncbi:MAG: hypothetical protein RL375_2911 [Pseudomonadota bacterium]|jgi:uncharacterized membrane protein YedE/YeeE